MLDEAVFTAEELGRAIRKADDENRWEDRRALRKEWVEFLDQHRGTENFFTLFHAHWNAQKEYRRPLPEKPSVK